MAEPIEMPFGLDSCGPKELRDERAMRPFAKLLWALVIIIIVVINVLS